MESRQIFLQNLAGILDSYEQEASVAETGVFQGEFAKWINQYFPNCVLHLFDTFQGFLIPTIWTQIKNEISLMPRLTPITQTHRLNW